MTEARTFPYVLYASNFKQVNAILILNNHIHLIFLSEWFVDCEYRPIHKMLLIRIQNWNPAYIYVHFYDTTPNYKNSIQKSS